MWFSRFKIICDHFVNHCSGKSNKKVTTELMFNPDEVSNGTTTSYALKQPLGVQCLDTQMWLGDHGINDRNKPNQFVSKISKIKTRFAIACITQSGRKRREE